MFKLLSEFEREYVVVDANFGTIVTDATRDRDSYELRYIGATSLKGIKDDHEDVYDAIILNGAEGVDLEVESVKIYEGTVETVAGSESVKVYVPDFWQ